MSKGKRYEEPKLNIKKVIAVIVAIIVIIMSIFIIKGILDGDNGTGRIVSQSYFAAFNDNKWGVIDATGNTVIDPSYEEMIIVPNSKNDIFLCTYDVNYETGEYKTKVLNSKNEEIFTQYQKVEAIQNKDENNQIWYEDNVLRFQKDGKYGLIDFSGKEILGAEYDSINAIEGIKNSLLIQKDGKFGVVNNGGNIVLEPIYTEITNLGKEGSAGYIVRNDEGKYGIVDTSKNQILEAKYDQINKVYGNDLYVVTESGTKKVVNKAGEDVITQGFEEITGILKTKDAGVIYKSNGKSGVMGLDGQVKIQPIYDDLKEGKEGSIIATRDTKVGIIDLTGIEKVACQYESIEYNEIADIYIAEDSKFNSNIMDSNYQVRQIGILTEINTDKGYFELRQGDEYKYYNFKFEERNAADILPDNTLFISKKDGKYGFVDKNKNVVVDYIYDDATKQNSYGYCGVKKDGKWGAIDNKGNVVIEPTYNLDDYLMIDFIGRWHFGKDINMNYYNQL